MMQRWMGLVLVALLAAPWAAEAQSSIHSILGVGFPGQAHSVRARALGGGWAMLDRTSAVNPATVAEVAQLSVNMTYATTFRQYAAKGTQVSGLRESRFPFGMLGGGVGRLPLSFAVSYSTFADRTFDIRLTDTVTVSSLPTEVQDEISFEGGVVDVRGAIGWRVSSSLYVGAGLHLLTGTDKARVTRDFIDSELRDFDDETDVSFSGYGLSGGLHATLADRRIRIGLAGRYNSRLTTEVGGGAMQRVSLPVSLNGGVSLVLTPSMRWATSATWKSWSRADGQTAATTFDVWGVGTGLELGSVTARFPVRLGTRYRTLPFSATADQPAEWAVAAGTGTRFAAGRAAIDVAIERLMRDGGGATERAWHVAVGLTILP